METLTRNCPGCNKELTYGSLYTYRRALRLNSKCNNCGPRVYPLGEVKRKCPKCGDEITYSNYYNFNIAEKRNTCCNKCNSIWNYITDKGEIEITCKYCGNKFNGSVQRDTCDECLKTHLIERSKKDSKNPKYREGKRMSCKKSIRKALKELQIEWRDFSDYGRPFLIEHPDFLEILQLKYKINNHLKNKQNEQR